MDFLILKGELNSPLEIDNSLVEGHDFNVDYSIGFNVEDKVAKADFAVDIKTESKTESNQEEARGYFQLVFFYKIDNLDDLIIESDKDKGVLIVDSSLANALASLTYSTSRGVLNSRFQGTALKDFILPVIDPSDLLNNN